MEEPNGDVGPYARNVTPTFDNINAAGWVKAAMRLNNPRCFCIVHRGEQADCTDGAQTPLRGGCSQLPLDDIIPLTAEDMTDDIGEEPDDDGEMRRPKLRSFPMTKTGCQKFEWKL
jgi:hypothetical protein